MYGSDASSILAPGTTNFEIKMNQVIEDIRKLAQEADRLCTEDRNITVGVRTYGLNIRIFHEVEDRLLQTMRAVSWLDLQLGGYDGLKAILDYALEEIDFAVRQQMGHDLDPVTGNCVACGAVRLWMQGHTSDRCVPDGKPHPRLPLTFDPA